MARRDLQADQSAYSERCRDMRMQIEQMRLGVWRLPAT